MQNHPRGRQNDQKRETICFRWIGEEPADRSGRRERRGHLRSEGRMLPPAASVLPLPLDLSSLSASPLHFAPRTSESSRRRGRTRRPGGAWLQWRRRRSGGFSAPLLLFFFFSSRHYFLTLTKHATLSQPIMTFHDMVATPTRHWHVGTHLRDAGTWTHLSATLEAFRVLYWFQPCGRNIRGITAGFPRILDGRTIFVLYAGWHVGPDATTERWIERWPLPVLVLHAEGISFFFFLGKPKLYLTDPA